MPGTAFVEGDRLDLHSALSEDYGWWAKWANTPGVRHEGFFLSRSPLRKDDVAAMVEEDASFHLFIACADSTPVGSVFLVDVDFENRNAELGYWIIPDHHGNGYATEAAELCLDYAFDELGLHRVWARTHEDNEPSKRVLEKLGFQREGVSRDHYYRGDYSDEYRFGILESER